MKKILCVVLCVIMTLSFVACRSEAELQQEQELKEQANTVMVQFLKNKYDIDVTLTNINVCVDRDSGFIPIDSAPLIPYVTAKFEYEGDEYCVCVNLTDENNPVCYDDFQAEEVTQILIDHINQLVGAEAIAWYNITFDVFENCSHVEDSLNKSNARLLNKKIEKFDDLVSNPRQNFDQQDYILSDLTVYYHNAGPFQFSEAAVQELRKMHNVTIVNLSETDTAYKYHEQAAGINLFRDEIIEYASFGYMLTHFVAGGSIFSYDLNNAIAADGMLFCSITDNVVPEISDIDDEAAATKVCTIGDYTCIIPVSDLGNGSVQSYEGVLLVDGKEVDIVTGYDCLETFHKDGEQYFVFNCASAEYAEYDAWYLREKISSTESEELS